MIHESEVRIVIAHTNIKQCTLLMKFHTPKEGEADPDALFYPNLDAHCEIKSATIPQKLCGILTK